MSVLDLDFYKLTMLQFIWKHYADVPVTFKLHSRKQDLVDIVNPRDLQRRIDEYQRAHLTPAELDYLRGLGYFEESFLLDLDNLLSTVNGVSDMAVPVVGVDGSVHVSGPWFKVSLWETVILSAVSERYSQDNVDKPSFVKQMGDISRIAESGAKWADFGTRRRHSYYAQARIVQALAEESPENTGFIGTSNVHLARMFDVKPVGTYAHELEMVLRTLHDNEFDTTRDVLTKWQAMYPRELRIALTDTYTTRNFLRDHGRFLLDNDWRGVRLDSGNPVEMGYEVERGLDVWGAEWDVVFSDGLDADAIIELQGAFGGPDEYYGNESPINPAFGWGTGLTNPDSDLSLVMKAVEANGQQTYKVTDDKSKAIR